MASILITTTQGAELSAVTVANDAGTPASPIVIELDKASYSNNELSEAARQIRIMADKLEEFTGAS